MKKILIGLALIGVILVSGCASQPTGQIIKEGQQQVQSQVTYHDGSCRFDTDCILAKCSETPQQVNCMSTTQMLTKMKCQDAGNIVSEKNYDVCGCVDGTCKVKV